MRKILLFFLMLPTLLWAQNFELGEVIVKLKAKENPSLWLNKVELINQIPTGLNIKQSVSKPFDIYLCTFNQDHWSEKELISALKASYLVEEAQVNHIITPRAVPNDLLYTNQWQYNNTGQNGGTPGADIDIEDAWEHTTGGLTVDGDTIVVCVIDGGFEISHPDLAPNMWVNHAEIAGNGIDDDSNGYVDDYRGWNAYNNSDNILPNSSHGTPVAGIVGANGNDNLGVAGVNWNVKIMGISGGGNEAQALAAYTYPYIARKKYNETNGNEGAFVVATNASWGVDYGQAANAPLWCAFYDSLGAVGILNAGATINGNVNVDVEGDLPTQCSSDYLISVTNMNNNDVKVNQAGYGATSIDMGAFGAGTYTVASGSSYNSFGGTSGATPHVAGTIALLYSAECSSFIDIAKQNPAGAALLIKDYIFSGLDANTSLVGITTQEGRLNVSSSMELLLEECSSCPSISELTASVTGVEALVNWVDSAGTANRILYKKIGESQWDTVFNVTSPYTLGNLDVCTEYKLKVQNQCEDTTWATSTSITMESENCCYVVGFDAIESNDNSINVEWDADPNANSYTLYYKLDGDANWIDSITVNSGTTNTQISNLESCYTYEIKLKYQCPEISQEKTLYLETKGCGSCVELNYCTPDEFTTEPSYISKVTLDDFEKNSMAGTNGYQNFEGTSQFKITRGQTNTIAMETQSNHQGFESKLWIDYDHNGDFESDEVYTGNQSGSNFNFNVTVPTSALNGLTRMRIVYQRIFGGNQIVACDAVTSLLIGEVEDYCVNIVEPVSVQSISNHPIEFYPNPVSNILNIRNLSSGDYHVKITNVLGQVVKSVYVLDYEQQSIQVTDLSEGLYTIEYTDENDRIYTKKFIKQ